MCREREMCRPFNSADTNWKLLSFRNGMILCVVAVISVEIRFHPFKGELEKKLRCSLDKNKHGNRYAYEIMAKRAKIL